MRGFIVFCWCVTILATCVAALFLASALLSQSISAIQQAAAGAMAAAAVIVPYIFSRAIESIVSASSSSSKGTSHAPNAYPQAPGLENVEVDTRGQLVDARIGAPVRLSSDGDVVRVFLGERDVGFIAGDKGAELSHLVQTRYCESQVSRIWEQKQQNPRKGLWIRVIAGSDRPGTK